MSNTPPKEPPLDELPEIYQLVYDQVKELEDDPSVDQTLESHIIEDPDFDYPFLAFSPSAPSNGSQADDDDDKNDGDDVDDNDADQSTSALTSASSDEVGDALNDISDAIDDLKDAL